MRMLLKVGDKVLTPSGERAVVSHAPGTPSYDSAGYIRANEGCLLIDTSGRWLGWFWQRDLKLIEPIDEAILCEENEKEQPKRDFYKKVYEL